MPKEEKKYQYRDPGARTLWLRGFSIVLVLLFVASLVSYMMQYEFLTDAQSGVFTSRAQIMAAGQNNDARVGLLATLSEIAVPAAQVMFFVWLYRAVANVHALGADIGVGAGLAIGIYFIPFVNLFLPPVAMNELVRASKNAANWRQQKGWWLVPVWWVLWLTMNIGGYALSFLTSAKDVESLKSATVLACGDKVVEILAWISVAFLTGSIARHQVAQRHNATHLEQVFG